MIIDTGKHIKCVFKNGTIIEGIVKEWTTGQVHLQSLNDESTMIILHPEDDIMLIKVLADKSEESTEEKGAPPLKEEIVAKLEEIRSEEDVDLQTKSIAELKQLVKTQEKQIITNKIKEHFPSAYVASKPNYSSQIDSLPRGKRRR